MSAVLQADMPELSDHGPVDRVANQRTLSAAMRPKVSVAMITYNHGKFIAQAIESVLMQETDFPVELVIGEDCSTDDTRAIVKTYAERYPNIIRPVLHERNQGMHKNCIITLESCRGEFMAILEGDDYWTDPLKLHKQVAFLEQNPKFTICGTAAMDVGVTSSGGEMKFGVYPEEDTDKEYNLEEGLTTYPFRTLTFVFRNNNGDFFKLPDWYKNTAHGDTAIVAMCAERGPIAYLNYVAGTYRIHAGGSWQGKSGLERCKMARKTMDVLNEHFSGRYAGILRRREFERTYSYYLQAVREGYGREAKQFYWASFFRFVSYLPMECLILGWGIYQGPRSAAWQRLAKRMAILNPRHRTSRTN